MKEYLFQLGHCPDISYAEMVAVNDRLSHPLSSLQFLGDVALASSASETAIKQFCAELGGTIRAAKVVHQNTSIKKWALNKQSVPLIIQAIQSTDIFKPLCAAKKKVVFGLSVFHTIENRNSIHAVPSFLQHVANGIKKLLQEQQVPCRFVLPDFRSGSPVLNGAQVDKNGLLDEGAEWGLFHHPQTGLLLTQTAWLQPYQESSQRDYGRPNRDARSGMLPPKLARMLINLARTSDTHTLLDPFCGSGGILTEAAWMGLDAAGFDISPKAVHDTEQNWEWMLSQTDQSTGKLRVFQGDARNLHQLCEPLYFDACVTEPYLGPPVSRPLSQQAWKRISGELTPLYIRALSEIKTVVSPGARVVFLVPRFRLKDQKKTAFLHLLSEIKLMGYTILDPRSHFKPASGRTTLMYSRPKQVVHREIFVLEV